MSNALRLFQPPDDASSPSPQPIHSAAPPRRPSVVTGGDVIRRFLADIELRRQSGKISDGHAANLKNALEAAPRDQHGNARFVGFAEIVGDVPVADLMQNDLTTWLSRNPQWKAADTRQNNIAYVINCFNWAAGEGILRPTPFMKTQRLKEERNHRRDATDAEAEAIWAAANPALRKAIWFVDRTGVRTQEVRELVWEKERPDDPEILWDLKVIRLNKHKGRRKMTKPKPRLIGLDNELLATLRQWHAARKHGQRFVFLTHRGKPWTKNNLDQCFARLRDKLGLAKDLTPYCFRHKFATMGRLLGLSPRESADLMGHTDEKMTNSGYTHVGDKADHFANLAEKMAAARAAKTQKEAGEPTPLFDDLD